MSEKVFWRKWGSIGKASTAIPRPKQFCLPSVPIFCWIWWVKTFFVQSWAVGLNTINIPEKLSILRNTEFLLPIIACFPKPTISTVNLHLSLSPLLVGWHAYITCQSNPYTSPPPLPWTHWFKLNQQWWEQHLLGLPVRKSYSPLIFNRKHAKDARSLLHIKVARLTEQKIRGDQLVNHNSHKYA